MSRIEEALRRSGAVGPRPVPETAPEADSVATSAPFDPTTDESPWDFGDTPPGSRSASSAPPDGPSEPLRLPSPESSSVEGGETLPEQVREHQAVPPGGPSLGVFHGFSRTVSEKLVVGNRVPAGAVEQYRKLAATLHHTQAERGIRVVMIASALANEGKTLTATNVALTLSESYRRRVLLIDADLRRPSLHEVFQIPNVSGLSDGLSGPIELPLSLVQVTPLLTLLPAGRPDPDPMSALSSGRMKHVLDEAASSFDWVVVDTPPVGLLPDANLLASMVDVALLVIRAGTTPLPAVQRAAEAIGRDRVIGVVLNSVEKSLSQSYGYGYGYYEYGYRYGPKREKRESAPAAKV